MVKKCLIYVLTLLLSVNMLWASPVLSIQLKRFQKEFSIVLAENPTTGYTWSIDSIDKKQLALVKKDYQAASEQRMGSGGKVLFTFKVLPGFTQETELSLSLKRPWEKDKGQVKTFRIIRESVVK